jgi:uncharacterized protein
MNLLSKETSPYLLQHANNPVNWVAWNDESLEKAVRENKPIIVSIGYSACHWCHVMEHESFENEAVAAIMNEYFVCIKVDREERPDVDGIYMEAVQAMGIHGGWPLNVFLMPDGKPFYGGTYFPPNKWAGICENIAEAFVNNRDELQKSAEGFTQNMLVSEADKYGLKSSEILFKENDFRLIINSLVEKSDPTWGGLDKAPKFPMPSIWLFMFDFLKQSKYKKSENFANTETQLKITLDRMAFGGIYDQIGGGFSRYSVDGEWFCPHFEKMLYDNAQLLSLYSKAYQQFGAVLYEETVCQTIGWLKREMLTSDGAFYSAQDADSESIEGKFYIWSKAEINQILGDKSEEFCNAFQITEEGNWENGGNILWKNDHFLNSKFEKEIEILLATRNKRIFPGLDDKILCAWNGLLISGLVDSYKAFPDKEFLQLAINCGEFIKNNFYKNGKLLRSFKNGEVKIEGFLEDYAAVISAFTALYQVTFNENWLSLAETLMITCLDEFFDETDQFFNFSSNKTQQLIANKKELFDNVIPCSNSIMAHNLYDLGVLLSKNDFSDLSKTMVLKMRKLILSNGDYLSNWANLALKQSQPKIEIVVFGKNCYEIKQEIQKYNLPNCYLLGTEKESNLPLFEFRQPPENKTFIYICINNTCSLPVENVEDAVDIIFKSVA